MVTCLTQHVMSPYSRGSVSVLLHALFDKGTGGDVTQQQLQAKLQSTVNSGQVTPPPGKTYNLSTVQKGAALAKWVPDDLSKCLCHAVSVSGSGSVSVSVSVSALTLCASTSLSLQCLHFI